MINKLKIFMNLLMRGRFACLYASLRRRYLYMFRRSYVDHSLRRRTGTCSAQGHCCSATMPWCRFLASGKCNAYDRQPFYCRIFPVDKRDQELSGVCGVCGYRFRDGCAEKGVGHAR